MVLPVEAALPAVAEAAPTAPADIVILNDFAHVQGGGSKVAILSARALAARGRRVLFFAAAGPVDPDLAASGARVICLGQPDLLTDPNRLRGAARGLWNPGAAAALAAVLDRLDPARTVVHVHGWMKALSSSTVRAAQARGFPIVSTLHDYSAVCPNGGFYNYRTERICGLRPMSPACLASNCDSRHYAHKLWRVARQAVQDGPGGLRGIRHFVVISETSRAYSAPWLPANARLHFVPNPIEIAAAPPVEAARNRRFAAVGRLAAEKGVRLFAAAARAEGAEALFVGDGYLRDEILRIDPRACVTGWVAAAEVARHLDGSRALVFASQWPETQGLVVAEAAARGVPAIVSDACAAREWVEDGVTGLLFRAGDLADLRRQIARLREDTLVSRLGRNAYERFWADPPTLARHAEALERLYQQIITEGEDGNRDRARGAARPAAGDGRDRRLPQGGPRAARRGLAPTAI